MHTIALPRQKVLRETFLTRQSRRGRRAFVAVASPSRQGRPRVDSANMPGKVAPADAKSRQAADVALVMVRCGPQVELDRVAG